LNEGIDVASIRRVARALSDKRPVSRADERAPDRSPMDGVVPMAPVPLELVGGRGHYERVITAIRNAQTSVWIATANVKELMIEDGRARPGRRRTLTRSTYVSVLAILDELAAKGVELRLLHAEIPSGPFRAEIANHPRLLGDKLELRRCPRVHMKVVVVDGELLYLGSANWTGAGLGAKGSGRRNFELGILTGDAQMLDQVQRLYDHVWRGSECAGCKLRDECPGPLAELEQRPDVPTGLLDPNRRLPDGRRSDGQLSDGRPAKPTRRRTSDKPKRQRRVKRTRRDV
jgi:phosphatidylserine/phosphatidylglycerophosphate/cardiolipin synthase-like enzyme